MKLPRRQFLHLAAGAAALPAVSRIARAQAYPSRPITMIVPFAPGGGTDVAARIVGDHMSRTLGQQVVIQNVAGAGGTIGSTRAMRADPDGYTILMGQMGTHAASVALSLYGGTPAIRRQCRARVSAPCCREVQQQHGQRDRGPDYRYEAAEQRRHHANLHCMTNSTSRRRQDRWLQQGQACKCYLRPSRLRR